MLDDFTLLQNYIRARSDTAFEALVARYVDLVYSSALRLSGDRHLAEDVTQAVFLVLAEKESRIKPPIVLPAWLLSVTRLTAANLRRSENTQRKGKEAVMHAQESSQAPSPDEWEHIAPFLDDALAGLSEQERAAITLRYFQHSSLDDVGRRASAERLADAHAGIAGPRFQRRDGLSQDRGSGGNRKRSPHAHESQQSAAAGCQRKGTAGETAQAAGD